MFLGPVKNKPAFEEGDIIKKFWTDWSDPEDDSDIDDTDIDNECKLSGNSPTATEKKIEFNIDKWLVCKVVCNYGLVLCPSDSEVRIFKNVSEVPVQF